MSRPAAPKANDPAAHSAEGIPVNSVVPLRRGFVNVGPVQVHYRQGGDGASHVPLAMIHASPGSSRQLADLASLLAVGRRVVAPGNAGKGD